MRFGNTAKVLAKCSLKYYKTQGYLIQDVEGGRLEEQQGQDEGEGEQGALASTQFRQGLLPDLPKCYSHLQACNPTVNVRSWFAFR